MKTGLFKLLAILLVTQFFMSCSSDDSPPAPTYDLAAAFQAIDISNPGVQDISIPVADGVTWSFRIIVPTITGNEKRPLVMAFHGESGGDPNAHKTTACYLEPGLAALNAFIIHPNAGLTQWYDIDNQQKVASLTQLAMQYWPVDLQKVVATGYSNGGNASWFFGENQPQIFSAAIPLASSYSPYNTDGSVRKMDIPMYVIHGENDDLFPIAQTQDWVDATNAVGSDITFITATSLGHYQPCDYVPYLQDGAQWLVDYVWN